MPKWVSGLSYGWVPAVLPVIVVRSLIHPFILLILRLRRFNRSSGWLRGEFGGQHGWDLRHHRQDGGISTFTFHSWANLKLDSSGLPKPVCFQPGEAVYQRLYGT